jgi:hypothetical protein
MKTDTTKKPTVKFNKRRKAYDLWSYVSLVLASLSWLIFLSALVMSYYAAPENHYGVLRYHGIDVRQMWLTPLAGYLYILIWLSALGSYIALMFDKFRSRRKHDNPHYSLVLLLVINLTWLIYIVYHITMMFT